MVGSIVRVSSTHYVLQADVIGPYMPQGEPLKDGLCSCQALPIIERRGRPSNGARGTRMVNVPFFNPDP